MPRRVHYRAHATRTSSRRTAVRTHEPAARRARVPSRHHRRAGEVPRRHRTAPHGRHARLHQRARLGKHRRVVRYPAREQPHLGGALRQAGGFRRAAEEEVGRAQVADTKYGAARRYEHRGVRRLLLRRLHPRLLRHGRAHGATPGAHGAHETRSCLRPGHRPALLHRGDSRHSVRGRVQHPRRRNLHRACSRFRHRVRHVQRPHDQSRNHVRRNPARVRQREGLKGDGGHERGQAQRDPRCR